MFQLNAVKQYVVHNMDDVVQEGRWRTIFVQGEQDASLRARQQAQRNEIERKVIQSHTLASGLENVVKKRPMSTQR